MHNVALGEDARRAGEGDAARRWAADHSQTLLELRHAQLPNETRRDVALIRPNGHLLPEGEGFHPPHLLRIPLSPSLKSLASLRLGAHSEKIRGWPKIAWILGRHFRDTDS